MIINRVSKRPLQLMAGSCHKDKYNNEYLFQNKILYVKFFAYNKWFIISNLDLTFMSIGKCAEMSFKLACELKAKYKIIENFEDIFWHEFIEYKDKKG